MSGWAHANAVRSASVRRKAEKLAAEMATARSFKEAAWRAGIPVRTAQRLRERMG